jgi:hypothetical protein
MDKDDNMEVISAAMESKFENAVAEILSAANFPEIMNKLNAHEKSLHGNGRPGLVETVAQLTPMIKKLEDHLARFNTFETETRVNRQMVHDSLDGLKYNFETISKKLDTSVEDIKKSMEPFVSLASNFTKISVAIAFLSFLGGGLIVAVAWFIENIGKIKGYLGHG